MFSQAELQALRQTISGEVDLTVYRELNLQCLKALEQILAHVVTALDGDRNADMNAGDTQEVVLDALERHGLLELAPPPAEDLSALERNLGMCRARAIPGAKMLFAICAGDVEPVLLENGGWALGNETRAGRILGRLLGTGRCEPWYIVAMRYGTARSQPRKHEQDAADRIAACARLVDLPLAGIYLDIRGGKTHTLVEKTDG